MPEHRAGGCNSRLHGFFSSQSFWKAGSARKGSQIGSSRKIDGVRGARYRTKPGISNKRARVEIGPLVSPHIVWMNATYPSRGGPSSGSLALGKRVIERV